MYRSPSFALCVIMLARVWRISTFISRSTRQLHCLMASLELPAWAATARKRALTQVDSAESSRRRLEEEVASEASAGGGSKEEIMQRLVKILTRLSLSNAHMLREVCAVTFYTFLLDAKSGIAVAATEAGKEYHERAQEIGKLNGPERAKAVEEQGPPYVHVWARVVQAAAATEGLGANQLQAMRTYWETTVVQATTAQQLGEQVRHCKCRPTRKKEGKPNLVRLVFAIDAQFPDLEKALIAAVVKQGGIRKMGPAPKGPLEREAEKLLKRLE